MVESIGERAESKAECQMLLIQHLIQGKNEEVAIQSNGDTQMWVYINEETGSLNVWPTSEIRPYEIEEVLPVEGHFDARALLSPDWSEVDFDD